LLISSPVEDLGRWVLLVVLCVAAAAFDLTSRKVPNALTFPAMALGLLFMGIHQGPPGVINGLAAGAGVFAFMMILRAIGGLGGGDVKLMTAIACAGGWPFVAWAAVYGMFIGGVMGLVVLVWKRNVFEALLEEFGRLKKIGTHDPSKGHPIPYAVALAAGALLALARDAGFLPANLGW